MVTPPSTIDRRNPQSGKASSQTTPRIVPHHPCVAKAELVRRITEVCEMVPAVIERLSAEQLEKQFPEVIQGVPMPTRQFLIHLYGHLNWHLGEMDYLRRILTRGEVIKPAGL